MTTPLSTRGYLGGAGGGGGGTISLDNPSPADDAIIDPERPTARYLPVSFDVINHGEIPYCIWVKYRNDDRGFVVYDSVVGFLPPFTGTWVAPADPTTDSGRLTVYQDGGWEDDISWLGLGGQANADIILVRAGLEGSDAPPDAP